MKQDRSQGVADFMGHMGRHLAYGCELFRLDKLFGEGLLLSDVDCVLDDIVHLALGPEQGYGAHIEEERLAADVQPRVPLSDDPACLKTLFHELGVADTLVLGKIQRAVLVDHILPLLAVEVAQALVDVGNGECGIDHGQVVRHPVEDGLHPLVGHQHPVGPFVPL